MPLYVYTCKACGTSFDDYASSDERDRPKKCPCGRMAKRDLIRTLTGGSFNGLMVDHPRWSEALGCNPDQVQDFKRTWPWMEFDSGGRCLVRNRAEKLRILKARGFVELR